MKKRFLTLIMILILCASLSVAAFATGEFPRVIDQADVLNDAEEEELLGILDELSERTQVDVAYILLDTVEGEEMQAAADELYEYCDYGFGEAHSGMLLLIAMEERAWQMSTEGFGMSALTENGLKRMENSIMPGLKDGDYAAAGKAYAATAEKLIQEAYAASEPVEANPVKTWVSRLAASLVGGGLVGLIGTGGLRSSLKSVHKKTTAGDYVNRNSLRLRENREIFLFTTLDRRAKPQNNNSGSRPAGVHHSSSGRTHGGGGGHF